MNIPKSQHRVNKESKDSYNVILSHLDIPRSTVESILAQFRKDGEVVDRPRSRRPFLLNIHDKRLVVRMLNWPKLGTATVVGRELIRVHGLCLSGETVRQSFQRQGLGL